MGERPLVAVVVKEKIERQESRRPVGLEPIKSID